MTSENKARLQSPEMIRLNEAVTAVNVESLMPSDWQRQILDVAEIHGKLVEFEGGKVSTSRENPDFTTIYKVVKGIDFRTQLPWLGELYRGIFRELVSRFAGEEVVVDPDKRFGANINQLIRGMGDGYERHIDVNDHTGSLVVSTIPKVDWGEFFIMLPNGTKKEVEMKAGWLLIFNGNKHVHGVNKLNPYGGSATRTTVLLDYVKPGSKVERPSDMEAIFGNGNGGK